MGTKIFMLIHRLEGGGAEWQCLMQSLKLAELGHLVEVCVITDKVSYLSRANFSHANLDFTRMCNFSGSKFKKLLAMIKAIVKLRKKIKHTRQQGMQCCVYAWLEAMHTLSYFSVLGLKAKLVWAIRNAGPELNSDFTKYMLRMIRINRILTRRVNALIANSNTALDSYVCHYGYAVADCLVSYNIIDQNFFFLWPAAKRRSVRAKHGISRDTFVILSLSRLIPGKNIEAIIRALQLIKEKLGQNPYELWVVGEGEKSYILKLKLLAEELGVNSQIRWLGKQNTPNAFYNLCDLYILASRSEGLSNSLIEAIVSGAHVLSTAVGDAERFLPPENIISDTTPHAIAQAVVDHCQRVQLEVDTRLQYKKLEFDVKALSDFLNTL